MANFCIARRIKKDGGLIQTVFNMHSLAKQASLSVSTFVFRSVSYVRFFLFLKQKNGNIMEYPVIFRMTIIIIKFI